VAFAVKKPVMAKVELDQRKAQKLAASAVVLPYKPAKKAAMARATLKMARQRHAVAAAR
jgi:hypothetical protein